MTCRHHVESKHHSNPAARWARLAFSLGLAALLCWAGLPAPASAHGVALEAKSGPAVIVSGLYSDGEAMSFAKVKITGPSGKTHQMGNADAGGRFAFVPQEPGPWQAVMEDGMGHRAETTWHQKPDQTAPDAAAPAAPAAPADPAGQAGEAPKWVRTVWGLSVLFWLSGLFFWWKGSRKKARA